MPFLYGWDFQTDWKLLFLQSICVSEDRATERTNAGRQPTGNWPCPGKLSQNQQLTQNRGKLWINGLQCERCWTGRFQGETMNATIDHTLCVSGPVCNCSCVFLEKWSVRRRSQIEVNIIQRMRAESFCLQEWWRHREFSREWKNKDMEPAESNSWQRRCVKENRVLY